MVFDGSHLSSSPAPHSSGCLGCAPLLCGVARVSIGIALSLFGVARADLFPSALDLACLEVSVPPQSCARSGTPLLVSDYVALGFSLLLQSFARAGSTLPALDFSHLGMLLPFRSLGRSEFALPPFGVGCSGAFLITLDRVRPDSNTSLRSFAQPRQPSSAFDGASPGLLLLLHSVARLDMALLGFGIARSGLLSSLSAMEATNLEPSMFSRSLACSSVLLFAFASSRLGLLLSSRSSGRSDAALPLFGVARAEPFSSALDLACLVVSATPRSCAHPSISLLILDSVHSEPFLIPRSFVKPSPTSLVSDGSYLSVSLPSQSVACPGMSLLVFGVARSGSLFSSSVMETTNLDFPMLSRSSTHLEASLVATGGSHLGVSLFLRFPACPGSAASLLGMSSLGLFLSASDGLCIGASLPSQVLQIRRRGLGAIYFDSNKLLIIVQHSHSGAL